MNNFDSLSQQKKYDYIIAGSGLSGLSLAYKIKAHPLLKEKSLLLIDPAEKNQNDRTWCFWSRDKDYFDDILYKTWDNILFASDEFIGEYNILPYQYKMIRGIDFYRHVQSFLHSQPGVDFLKASVSSFEEKDGEVHVHTSKSSYQSALVFKSFLDKQDFSGAHFVWQHFKGYVIETDVKAFDPDVASFMDFRVEQADETRFFYVLPFSEKKALIEIAIFSNELPDAKFYDPFLEAYISEKLGIENYKIIEVELGKIPMTTHSFKTGKAGPVINIGTNAGSVKASSGYAFKRIQEETDTIIQYLAQDKILKYRPRNTRFHFYDKILLNAILTGKISGSDVFCCMFSKLKPQTVFAFLDEKGGFLNELKMFGAPPTKPFLKAFLEEFRKSIFGR